MASSTIFSASQTPLANLLISLAFGVGQILVGAGMAVSTARKQRWRQLRWFGLAVLGVWIACSGLTEVIVSGAALLAQHSRALSSAQAAQVRASADQAFLITTLMLLLALGAFPLLAWVGRKRPARQRARSAGKERAPDEWHS